MVTPWNTPMKIMYWLPRVVVGSFNLRDPNYSNTVGSILWKAVDKDVNYILNTLPYLRKDLYRRNGMCVTV